VAAIFGGKLFGGSASAGQCCVQYSTSATAIPHYSALRLTLTYIHTKGKAEG